MGDKTRGLYGKFLVSRQDGSSGSGQKHDGCDYFVLDITHDPHAKVALRAYAESARSDGYEVLADELEVKSCDHEYEGFTQPGTVHGPTEYFSTCKHCGAENPGD